MESEGANISDMEKYLDWASGQGPTAVAETAICQRFLLYLYRLAGDGRRGKLWNLPNCIEGMRETFVRLFIETKWPTNCEGHRS